MMYLKVFFKNIYYLISILILSNFDKLIYKIFNKRESLNKKNILFIRNDNLGDFVLWHNSFLNFITHYRKYNIYLICNESLFPYLKKIFGKKINLISLNRESFIFNLFYRYFFLKKLYKNNFQIIINPLISRNLVISDLIIKNFNHSTKIAFEDNQDQLPKFFSNLSNSYYDKLIPKGKFDDVTNNKIFFEQISGKLLKKFDYPNIKKSQKKYAVISMSTSDKKRDIQTDKIIKITNFLLEKTNLKIYFTGKNNDINKYLKIKSQIHISKKNRIENKINNFSISEFINCVRGSELVITAETATMHIANIFKKKTLSILGGGYYSRFVNIKNELYFNKYEKKVYNSMSCFDCRWNCRYKIQNGNYLCIDEIDINRIIRSLERII